MIEKSSFNLDDDPKVRAYVLAEAANSQRHSSVYRQGVVLILPRAGGAAAWAA